MVVVLRVFPAETGSRFTASASYATETKTRNLFRMMTVTQGYDTNVVSKLSFRLFLYKNNSILSAEHFRSLLKRVLIKKKKVGIFDFENLFDWYWILIVAELFRRKPGRRFTAGGK